MFITLVVAGVLFGMMLLMAWNGYRNIELSRLDGESERPAVAPVLQLVQPAEAPTKRCLLCNAPLTPSATRDEVVNELQRKIDLEQAWVVNFIDRPAPEMFARHLYQSAPMNSGHVAH